MQSTVVVGVGLRVATVKRHASVFLLLWLWATHLGASIALLLIVVDAHLEIKLKLSMGFVCCLFELQVQHADCSFEQG